MPDALGSSGHGVRFCRPAAKVMATSAEAAGPMSVQMNIMDRVAASQSEVVISSPVFYSGRMGVQAFGDLRKRMSGGHPPNSLAATTFRWCTRDTHATAWNCCERASTSTSQSHAHPAQRAGSPSRASLGRLHAKTAVIDIDGVHRVHESRSAIREHEHRARNFAECPELARRSSGSSTSASCRAHIGCDSPTMAKAWNGWRRMIRERSCFPRSPRSRRSCVLRSCCSAVRAGTTAVATRASSVSRT